MNLNLAFRKDDMLKSQRMNDWKAVVALAALLAFALILALTLTSVPASAQEGGDETFCAIPEGCDTDGDGSPDVPAGTPAPGQYSEEPVCLLPEGCDPDAEPTGPPIEGAPTEGTPTEGTPTEPDQNDQPICLIPEGCDTDGDGETDTPAGTPVLQNEVSADEAVPPSEDVTGEADSSSSSEPLNTATGATVLPDTGGPLLPALAAGLLLLGGGLLIRRTRR